jgi:hypothetical protein
MSSFRGFNPLLHPPFPETSEAALSKDSGPVRIEAKEIQYAEEDDAVIDAFHRAAST